MKLTFYKDILKLTDLYQLKAPRKNNMPTWGYNLFKTSTLQNKPAPMVILLKWLSYEVAFISALWIVSSKDYKEDERTQNLLAPDNNIDFLKHFMNIFLKNQSTELYYASF